MLERFGPLVLGAGLFCRQFDPGEDNLRFCLELKDKFPQFDRDPFFQPLPQNARPDVPRIILQGEGGRLQLDLAPAKVALKKTESERRTFSKASDEFISLLLALEGHLAEHGGLRVVRMGYIALLFNYLKASANERIKKYFLQEQKDLFGTGVHEIQLNVLTKIALEGEPQVNRWVKVRPKREANTNMDFGLQVEVDINTVTDQVFDRGRAAVERFFRGAAKHIEDGIEFLGDENFLA
jgi:hypothetical protein